MDGADRRVILEILYLPVRLVRRGRELGKDGHHVRLRSMPAADSKMALQQSRLPVSCALPERSRWHPDRCATLLSTRRNIPFKRRFGPPLGFSLLAVALCCLLVRQPGLSAWRLRSSLVAAVGTEPLFAARLAGFRYPPRDDSHPHPRGMADRVARAVGRLGGDARRHLRGLDTPDARHLKGLTQLLGAAGERGTRDLAQTIGSLRGAVDADPTHAMFRSDLAAVLWLRWRERAAVGDLLDALEQAEFAVALEPRLLEGRYNLSLALESLNLWSQATRELQAYLELDSHSPWAEEAMTRLRGLDRIAARPREAWFEELRLAAVTGDLAAASRLVDEDPGRARDYGHDHLLPQWAQAYLRGGSPESEPLAAASVIADALAVRCDDRTLLDSVRAASGESAARAYRAWGVAVPLLRRRAYEQALPSLRKIEEALTESSEVPLALLVRYYRAVLDYQRGEYEAAMVALEGLADPDDQARYPGLSRMSRRMEGGIHHLWGNLPLAKERYLQAIEHGGQCAEREAMANDKLPLAVVVRAMGEGPLAQQLWWEAVQERPAVRRADYLFLLYTVPVDSLLASGHRAAARRFQAEAVGIALASGDRVVLAEALLKLAEILERDGEIDDALAILDQAAEAIAEIEDSSVREFREMEELAQRAAVLSASDVGSASAALDQVVRRVQALGYRRILPRILRARAELFGREGRTEAEEAYLRAAIAEIERESLAVPELEPRLAVLREGQETYDHLATRAWRRGDYREALAVYDRVRSIARWRSRAEPPDDLVPALGQNEALVAFGTLDELAVAWWIRGNEVRGVELSLSREQLGESVSDLGEALRWARADDRLDLQLSALFRQLFEDADLADVRRLRIVPYETFQRVPFSALLDVDGRPLVERFEIVLHPYLPSAGPRRVALAPFAVLAVGKPRFSQRRHPGLADLPGTRVEANAVYRVYGADSRLLLAGDATRAAVLGLLPRLPVAHLATHAVTVPGRRGHAPQRQLLVTPVPGPERSSGISATDLLSLDLSGLAVVVLATCATTSGELEGDGGLGIVSALLSAGAGTVVASPWPQGDGDATDVLIRFHHYLARDRMTPASALRRAKLDHLDRPGTWPAFEVFQEAL